MNSVADGLESRWLLVGTAVLEQVLACLLVLERVPRPAQGSVRAALKAEAGGDPRI